MIAIEHKIGGVGDRQDEARRVGDEGADEQIGQRLDLGLSGGREDGRGQHHGRRVVGQKDGDDRADAVDQQEQPRRATCASG